MDYKGLRDCHLNIFWQYDGDPRTENNITKAFINTIDSLNSLNKKYIFKKLFGIDLPDSGVSFEYYLQSGPTFKKIEKISEDKRIMFGFCPSGKCWGFDGDDIKDEKKLKEAISKELSKKISDASILNSEVNKLLEEHLEAIRGGSRPDGWIFINIDSKPEYVIAMENKLYDLDPTQINNHIEKSLLIINNKKPVIYKKYKEILKYFDEINTYTTNQFIEYMTILGYKNVDDFIIACGADFSIRRKLAIPFGREILSNIHSGKIDKRRWNVTRCYVDYAFLREINMIFNDDCIEVSLAFGSTQNTGKKMLETIGEINISNDHISNFNQSFHLLYKRGRNIGNSYIDCPLKINDYISYWKRNISLIKTYTPNDAISLYEKMLKDEIMTEENFKRLKNQLTGKKNLVFVVPEINIVLKWSYDEIVSLSKELFMNNLKHRIDEILIAMKLKN